MQRMPVFGCECGSKILPRPKICPDISDVPWHKFDKKLPDMISLELVLIDTLKMLNIVHSVVDMGKFCNDQWQYKWGIFRTTRILGTASDDIDFKLTKQGVHKQATKLCHHLAEYRLDKGCDTPFIRCKCCSHWPRWPGGASINCRTTPDELCFERGCALGNALFVQSCNCVIVQSWIVQLFKVYLCYCTAFISLVIDCNWLQRKSNAFWRSEQGVFVNGCLMHFDGGTFA